MTHDIHPGPPSSFGLARRCSSWMVNCSVASCARRRYAFPRAEREHVEVCWPSRCKGQARSGRGFAFFFCSYYSQNSQILLRSWDAGEISPVMFIGFRKFTKLWPISSMSPNVNQVMCVNLWQTRASTLKIWRFPCWNGWGFSSSLHWIARGYPRVNVNIDVENGPFHLRIYGLYYLLKLVMSHIYVTLPTSGGHGHFQTFHRLRSALPVVPCST